MVDYFAGKIKSAHLEVPGVFALVSTKPLAFLLSQALIFLQPFIAPVAGFRRTEDFIGFVADRENWESIAQKLENRDPKAAGGGK